MIYPAPAVLVSCGEHPGVSNLLTVAWTGTICSDPAMCYISVRPERYSYDLIRRSMEFTINLTSTEMARATDFCGVRSGRDLDKWEATGLTPARGHSVRCPFVDEAPLSIECKVKKIIPLGTHDMFIAEVLNVIANETFIDPATGKFKLEDAALMSYIHGGYYSQGERLGTFGWTVKKKK